MGWLGLVQFPRSRRDTRPSFRSKHPEPNSRPANGRSPALGGISGLEGLRFPEDQALLSRHGHLLAVEQNKKKALGVEHPHLLYAAEIDYTIAPSAKERGGIQPALTLSKGTADQGRGIVKVDTRVIAACFQHGNVGSTHHPAVHVVTDENEVVILKYSTVVLRDLFALESW